ncbi:ATG12 [Candida oxycetoniae]|uniref:Ubiquitin-like protein ATG12 n=1 Tax=Candida oxycetoniae TaxID=497107 RepID=A0AAI9T0A2_9ASCO|nr:ATG12 [Candida oxycetoniae]KAI3406062.1 ATG12 [Candida oxycetoniae]
MSSIIRQSDSDSESKSDTEKSSSLSSSLEENANIQQIEDDDTRPKPMIPISTSIILDQLPISRQQKLEQTINEQIHHERLKTLVFSKTSAKEKGEEGKGEEGEQKLAIESNKISLRFQPIGSTRGIVPKVFKISTTQTVSTINKFLCQKLKQKAPFHLYIQNSFEPNPDEKIGDLYNLFKTNNELIISYCNTLAFG